MERNNRDLNDWFPILSFIYNLTSSIIQSQHDLFGLSNSRKRNVKILSDWLLSSSLLSSQFQLLCATKKDIKQIMGNKLTEPCLKHACTHPPCIQTSMTESFKTFSISAAVNCGLRLGRHVCFSQTPSGWVRRNFRKQNFHLLCDIHLRSCNFQPKSIELSQVS